MKNIRYVVLITGMLFCYACFFSQMSTAEDIVLGYYPAWVKESYPADAVDFSILTHIIHAFAWPDADGSISLWDGFVYPELVEKCHASGRKIMVALGGWGNCKGFPPMSADPEIRARFVKNIMEFCEEHGYDGVDIDWEFPENPMIFYDDPVSIANKCTYARGKKLRGVMIWSIGSDYMDGKQPLLETIGKNWGKTHKKR
ncbi:glycosyl hydrolase family 18 protein [Candidatus Omnitrophota bacterium]